MIPGVRFSLFLSCLPSLASSYAFVSMTISREHLFMPSFNKYTLSYSYVHSHLLETKVMEQSYNRYEHASHERSSVEGHSSSWGKECFPRVGESWAELWAMSRQSLGEKSLERWTRPRTLGLLKCTVSLEEDIVGQSSPGIKSGLKARARSQKISNARLKYF